MKHAWFRWLGLLMALALGGCGAPVEEPQETTVKTSKAPLINGVDNRIQNGQTADWSLLDRGANSIAAVVPAANVNEPPPDPPWQPVTFNAPTLKQAHNLCDGVRYEAEQTPATCTATLIDDDLVITDGHCVTAANCADTRFVFDYWQYRDGDMEFSTLYHVYHCQSVVVSQTSPSDYAIVRLDRSALDHQKVAPIRRNRAPLAQGLPVVAMGHADGTFAKISPGGIVTSQDGPGATTFRLNSDGSTVGSLGSGIFYQETGELAGIWTDPSHGEPDYVPGPAGSTPPGCMVPKVCPESGCGTGQSLATYVGVALEAYCFSNSNPRLCEPRNTVAFSASPTLHAAGSVFLEPEATLDYGTCALPGSSANGDTMISLRGPYYTNDYGFNDDACGLASRATYTTPPMTGGRYGINPSCYSGWGTCSGVIAYTVSGPTGGSYSYTATNTASAQMNTQNFTISLREGETLIAGTCGVENANFTGDTFLNLRASAVVAFNDDACPGFGSQLTYTSPIAQTLTLEAGCYSMESCSGTVAWTKGLSNIPFSATNTNSGAQNTTDRTVHLVEGDKVTIGTCGLPGASYTGDTVVGLFLGSTVVSGNDNDCGGLGSRSLYRVTTAGDYTVKVGCAGSSSCSGNAVVRVTPPTAVTGTKTFIGHTPRPCLPSNEPQICDTTDPNEVRLLLRAGDVFSAGTCPNLVPGASGSGDTLLSLVGPDGLQTWTSDDNCPGNPNPLLSAYTNMLVTPDKAGAYTLHNNCYNDTETCSGTTLYSTQ